MIGAVKKLIRIGTSKGIVLSKKVLMRPDAKPGDSLHTRIELVEKRDAQSKLPKEYNTFVKEYG